MNPLTLKRLLYIKKIFLSAEESNKDNTEIGRVFSLLLADNAIEMLLKTIATDKDIALDYRKDPDFKNLWNDIKNILSLPLPLKTEMFNLHEERNLVQHQGSVPSEQNMDRHLGYGRRFLEQAIFQIYNKNFDEIYLSDLIQNEEFKNRLKEMEKKIEQKSFNDVPRKASELFSLMLATSDVFKHFNLPHRWTKHNFTSFAFDSCSSGFNLSGFSSNTHEFREIKDSITKQNEKVKKCEKALQEIHELLDSLENFASDTIEEFKAQSIIHDYVKFSKFKILIPKTITHYIKDQLDFHTLENPKPYYNKEETIFIFNFVLDVALKLQELQQFGKSSN
ncbi:MAG: hypothetical protein O8C62_06485 [Candidatus Methanoperedens sp.]|nr:hypothetical protein [Candidatus Methanoperedens sp.]